MELQTKEKTTERHKHENLNSRATLTGLPLEMVEHILSYVSYDQIAKLRLVNKLFNNICSATLNKGFIKVEDFHSQCVKAIKAKLPRRESERKTHPLARHSDIVMAVETRLSMLSMTFTKYIEARHCCFIPGKVLDEAMKVLRIVHSSCAKQSGPNPIPLGHILPRPHDFLQEYRDVSSMAMEHFDEKILPAIREKMKKENPYLQYYKVRQGSCRPTFPTRRSLPLNIRRIQIPKSDDKNEQMVHSRDATSNKEPTDGTNQNLKPDVLQLSKNIHDTVKKCKNTRKRVEVLHTKINSTSSQCAALKRKIKQQGVIIKQLMRGLRKTKIAVNKMSKERKRYKCLEAVLKDESQSNRKASCNLSVHETLSISIVAENNNELPTSKPRGVKRMKLNESEEGNNST